MTIPGFTAQSAISRMANRRQRAGKLHGFDATVHPAQAAGETGTLLGNGMNLLQVGSTSGENIDPSSWYAVHPPKYGIVHPGQTDDFVACVGNCVAATKDYAACQRGCCKQFTHYSACVIP